LQKKVKYCLLCAEKLVYGARMSEQELAENGERSRRIKVSSRNQKGKNVNRRKERNRLASPKQPLNINAELLNDAEVCAILRVSTRILRKHLLDGPPREGYSSAGDVRLIRHITIGGKRRWPRVNVMKFINGEG